MIAQCTKYTLSAHFTVQCRTSARIQVSLQWQCYSGQQWGSKYIELHTIGLSANFSVIPVNTSENIYCSAVTSSLHTAVQTNSATIFLWSLRKSYAAGTAKEKHFAQYNVIEQQFLAEYCTYMSMLEVFQSQVPTHMYQLQRVYVPELWNIYIYVIGEHMLYAH